MYEKLRDLKKESKESKDMLLYSGDNLVMRINFDLAKFDIVNERLIPWQLKDKFEFVEVKEPYSSYQMTQIVRCAIKNKNAIIGWLANRTLSLNRKNAKWLYNLINVEQSQDDDSRAKISLMCRAVSLLDNYWVKTDGDYITWNDVNLRHNSLNDIIAQVALHGTSLSIQGSLCTPEFSTNGAYAKAWRRYDDGSLWLHKAGANGNAESRIEVMCSRLLDKMNVSHCYYKMTKDGELSVCACPAMSSDKISIVDGMSIYSYCVTHNLDFNKFILTVDYDGIYKMWIVDYLISNRDRHGQNWGFYYYPDKMELLRCHPLFDHNNAFDIGYMQDRDAPYQFGEMTIRQAAKYAMQRTDFYFYLPIVRSDFITDRQYKEFMWRANDLGVKVKVPTVWKEYISNHNIKDENAEFIRLHDKFHLYDSSLFWKELSSLL